MTLSRLDNGAKLGVLARGPWPEGAVRPSWMTEPYSGSAEAIAIADAELDALRERNSPADDGWGVRVRSFLATDDGIWLELQPLRWALRLVPGDASQTLVSHVIVRDTSGRWLAGRRAAWVSSWPGHWSLGAGGGVEPQEHPLVTMRRELGEEWGIEAMKLQGVALLRMPNLAMMLVGTATVVDDAELKPDDEHDAHAWWPPDPAHWPPEASDQLRRSASIILNAENRDAR